MPINAYEMAWDDPQGMKLRDVAPPPMGSAGVEAQRQGMRLRHVRPQDAQGKPEPIDTSKVVWDKPQAQTVPQKPQEQLQPIDTSKVVWDNSEQFRKDFEAKLAETDKPVEADPWIDPTNIVGAGGATLAKFGVKAAAKGLAGNIAGEIAGGTAGQALSDKGSPGWAAWIGQLGLDIATGHMVDKAMGKLASRLGGKAAGLTEDAVKPVLTEALKGGVKDADELAEKLERGIILRESDLVKTPEPPRKGLGQMARQLEETDKIAAAKRLYQPQETAGPVIQKVGAGETVEGALQRMEQSGAILYTPGGDKAAMTGEILIEPASDFTPRPEPPKTIRRPAWSAPVPPNEQPEVWRKVRSGEQGKGRELYYERLPSSEPPMGVSGQEAQRLARGAGESLAKGGEVLPKSTLTHVPPDTASPKVSSSMSKSGEEGLGAQGQSSLSDQSITTPGPEGKTPPLPPKKPGFFSSEGGAFNIKQFFSGKIPVAKAPANPAPGVAAVEAMYDKADEELGKLRRPGGLDFMKKLRRSVVDVSGNVKADLMKAGPQGREAAIRLDLSRGANAKSKAIYEREAENIYDGLTPAEENLLNRMIQSRRTLAIDAYKPGMEHPDGLTGAEHQRYLNAIPPEFSQKLTPLADQYFTAHQRNLEEAWKGGLISDRQYQDLTSKGDYSPRWFIQHLDPERTYSIGGKTVTVRDSGIKSLDEGSTRMLENDSRLLLSSCIARTQARIMRNNANKALYDLAVNSPNNGMVWPGGKAKAGETVLTYLDKGVAKEMIVPDSFAREWIQSDPQIDQQVANVVGWLSGAKVLRASATSLNPEFALTNLPRDMAHIWLTTEEYSPNLLKGMGQMGIDLKAVWRDARKRQGRYEDYVREGGDMDFMTVQGRISSRTKGVIGKLQDFLGWVGNTSEIVTRLALRERALKNGAAPHEATWIARNYLDFAQGGSFAKAADTAVPYLNAGIQGTRGLIRAAHKNPKLFTAKVAQLGTLATGLYLANRFNNPEAWKQVPDREKVNNWIITTPLTYKDRYGDTRYFYFAIAKDQGQRVFATLFESLMAKTIGDKVDGDRIAQAVHDFIPIMPSGVVPPTIKAMLGYGANKDFWRNEDIWREWGPKRKKEPQEEYTAYTHPVFVKAGQALNLSPERLRYALSQYFSSGNIYTSLVGETMKSFMDEMPEHQRQETWGDIVRNVPGLRRFLKSTDPYTPYQKEAEEAREKEVTRQYVQRREIDRLADAYYNTKGKAELQAVRQYIGQQEPMDRERLMERFQHVGKIHGLPDRRWWMAMSDMPPEAKAAVFWSRYQKADAAEQNRLLQQAAKLPGFQSDRFRGKFMQLRQGGRIE